MVKRSENLGENFIKRGVWVNLLPEGFDDMEISPLISVKEWEEIQALDLPFEEGVLKVLPRIRGYYAIFRLARRRNYTLEEFAWYMDHVDSLFKLSKSEREEICDMHLKSAKDEARLGDEEAKEFLRSRGEDFVDE